MSSTVNKQAKSVATGIATFILMIVMCVPGLWVILSGFRPNREILAKPPIWVPQELTLNNFAKIFLFKSI